MGEEKLVDSRLKFIDVARSFAIIFMLEGHFISLTYEDYVPVHEAIKANGTSGYFFLDLWHNLRNYTAPLFFTITGLVLGYLLLGHKGESFWKQKRVSKGWKRGLMIIGWGYVLQLNLKYYFKSGEIGSNIHTFHVLQCIGTGLLTLIALYGVHHIFKKVRFSLILFIAGVTVFAFYPVLKSYGGDPVPEGAPLFIQNMIYKHDVGYGAVFTIFPHMGYILFGACFGALFREYSKYIKKFWFPLLFVAGSLLLIYVIKESVRFFVYRYPSDYGFIGGFWLYKRLKYIVIFIGILMYAEQFIKLKGKFSTLLGKYFIQMGQNTLNIYIVHSIILYGTITGYGINSIYDKSLSFGEAAFQAFLFILFFALMTHFQPQIKKALLYFPRKIFLQRDKT
ncbi:DUF1624 domain-containing protein [Crocinitomicaceae bacterium]|nr:DUF1624 domain-containing protein [Crocinitomicaceae bacterium]